MKKDELSGMTERSMKRELDKGMRGGGAGRIAGFDVLRVFFSFCVVLCHFWVNDRSSGFYEMLDSARSCAVHGFVLLAFYFSAESIECGSFKKLQKRMFRLLKPYLIWPLIMFWVYNVSSVVFKRRICYGLKELGFQFLMGHTPLEAVMYFNWVMMVLTVLFTGMFALFQKKTAAAVLICITAGAAVSVYSGCNYDIFAYFPYEMCYPLGRLAELLPSAAAGMALSHVNFHKMKAAAGCFWVYIYAVCIFELLWLFYVFHELEMYFQPKHFGYGIPVQILAVLLLAILCYDMPVKTVSGLLSKAAVRIAGYTQGIYCIHYAVGLAWMKVASDSWVQIQTSVFPCVGIYVISLLLAAGISKLPWKWCRDIVC